MSFLDENTLPTDPKYLEKVKAATDKAMKGDSTDLALLMAKGPQNEKKGRDLDGDGDVDSDDYLAARDAAIKRAQAKKKVNEKEYNQDISLDKFKAIQPGTEVQYMGSTSKVKSNDGFTLDLENGQKVNYVMFNKKGRIPEGKKTVELPADTTFTLDLKHLMKKHMDEGKSQEDVVKLTKKLMDKLHDKGEVTVKGTKIIFKENYSNNKQYLVTFKLGSHYGRTEKKEITVTAASEKDAIDMVKKRYRGELATDFYGQPFIDARPLTAADVDRLTPDLDLDEADVPMDMPVDLPEPEVKKPRRKGPPRLVAFDTDQDSHFTGEDDYDYEGSMAKSELLKMKKYANALCDMIEDESQLEAWLQSKITKAADYMSSVYHYLDYQKTKMNEEEEFKPLTQQEKDSLVKNGKLKQSELAAYEKFLKDNPDLPDSMPKAIKAFRAKK